MSYQPRFNVFAWVVSATVVVVGSGAAPAGQEGASTDRAALVALYEATDGPNWSDNTNWNSDAPLDTWRGVGTDSNGRVTGLRLANNGLTGPIPVELGNLANLESLNLDNNGLTGLIPAWLADMANLTSLFLRYSGLDGPIPMWLGRLNLNSLGLSGIPSGGGPIPAWVGGMTNASGMASESGPAAVSGSERQSVQRGFTAPVAGGHGALRRLSLSGNGWTGPIPYWGRLIWT